MRRLVYVSGKLGAGKTSLAIPLAAELGYSLVTKDLIKETLHDALYVPGEGEVDRAWSLRVGSAAMDLLWALAARAGDMVIEANFHPESEDELNKLRGLDGNLVEVHCACPADVAVARYNARSRHEVHVLKQVNLTAMERYKRPVGVGSLITVDTTAPVDIAAVADEVRRIFKYPVGSADELPAAGGPGRQRSPDAGHLALPATGRLNRSQPGIPLPSLAT